MTPIETKPKPEWATICHDRGGGREVNDKTHIERWPNRAGLMRGPNMLKKFCHACHNEKTHGYSFYSHWQFRRDEPTAVFVCDDCLKAAKARP